MENECGTVRILWLFIALISCAVCGFASDPPLSQPVATLSLSAMHPSGQGQPTWVTVAFSSETSIAVGRCRQDCANKECSLFLVRWEGGTLRPFAQTLRFDSGVSIHPASEGQILTIRSLPPIVLYSADLSTSHDLSIPLSVVSPSGRTVAEIARGSWKLYRLTDRLEPLREGTGDLRSVSDEVVVIQDGKAIKVETLDGRRRGSFSVSDEVSGFHAAMLGDNRLYLPDCRRTVRVVDFEGKTQLEIHQHGLCAQGDTTSSADGRRMLFDFTDHKTSGLQHVLENIQTITSLGMVGPEDFNREEVRVVDTVTGKTCFDWHRSFSVTYSQIRSAAISPSGEFVAIAAENTLSIYRLPAVCGASTITSNK
jgi:hypothetical protein